MFQASATLFEKKFLLVSSLAACCFKFKAVLQIRIRRIRKFLGLLDPDLGGRDPDPSFIKRKQ
jgi:hypothetical protein